MALALSLRRFIQLLALGLLTATVLLASSRAEAQGFSGPLPAGALDALKNMSPEDRAKAIEQMKKHGMAVPPELEGKPAEEKKPDGDKKPEGEKKPGGEASGSGTVKRPEKFDGKPDKTEIEKAKPDKDGKVQFSFRGQPWPEVMQWFADVSNSSLDWQELPGDYLNLTTTRKYTLEETRDLLNMHLQARGFAMLRQGEVLTVFKLDKVDPSLIPTVDADDLEDYAPHDFVKVRFDIPETIDPTKAVEDVKPLLSPAAKITPLLASKRLLVIDVVGNLRSVRKLYYDEQARLDGDVRPRVYPIRHRRAEYVADQIMIVLGIDVKKRQSPQDMQMEMQMQQARMQMMQQMGQGGGGQGGAAMLKKDEPQVHIAVDKRRNVLLVNAEPKELAIIERTIKECDVPSGGGLGDSGSDPAEEDALGPGTVDDGGALYLEKYQTVTASPDNVITALNDVGNLNPLTQLQGDSASKTIFAYATAADHRVIKKMLDKLDGTGRGLRVVWLNRRSRADQVAGTIQALMVGEKKKEQQRRPWYYYEFGGNNDQDDNKDKGFRIQADVENNRLLLWANDAEFKEVSTLLEELGAATTGGKNNPNKVRVLEPRSPEETAKLLENLQQAWGGKNELNIQVAPRQPEEGATEKDQPEKEKPKAGAEEQVEPDDEVDRTTSTPLNLSKANVMKVADSRDHRPNTKNLPAPSPLWGGQGRGSAQSPTHHLPQSLSLKGRGPEGIVRCAETSAAISEPPVHRSGRGSATTAQIFLAADAIPAPAKEKELKSATAPPVNVIVAPDGRIIVSSEDQAALDQVEQLVEEIAPQQRKFEKFQLFNSRASSVSLNLEEFFKDELAEKDESFGRFFFFDESPQQETPTTLGKRPKLRFIWDPDTNTIVVQNASPAQLETVRQLIKIYDKPVDEDAVAKRQTKIVQLKYSRAATVAAALKEVYRDLLSSKDKEFQGKENDRGGGQRNTYYQLGGSSSNKNKKAAPVKVSFEGALSIGVDELSNTLIISAEENVWEDVHGIIIKLDEEAKPNTVVQVHELRGSLKASELQKALASALSKPWPGGKPEAAAATTNIGGGNNGQNNQNQNGNDNRRNRGRRGN